MFLTNTLSTDFTCFRIVLDEFSSVICLLLCLSDKAVILGDVVYFKLVLICKGVTHRRIKKELLTLKR